MPKISFIVPVYKVEKYLPKMIASVKAQTLEDWEAILVDDGSPDGSGAICDEAARADNRFKVIHKENGGVGSARNAALDMASGEYIHFLDSDDSLEPNMAKELTELADANNADIVYFGLFIESVDDGGNVVSTRISPPPFVGVERDEPCKRLFDRIATSHLLSPKLYRRSLIEKGHYRFPNKSIGEDGMFITQVYRESPECVVGVDKAYYHYSVRIGSATRSFHQAKLDDNFYLTKEIALTVEKWGLLDSPMHLAALKYAALRDLQIGIKNMSYSGRPFSEQCKMLKRIMKDERMKTVISDVPLSRVGSRNDKIKLLFLKLRMYSTVMLLSNLNK